jgi:hypothetical protein
MDLTEFPDYLNDAMFGGANQTAAEMLLMLGVVTALLLPAMLARQRLPVMMVMALLGVVFCTAVGWVTDNSILILMIIGIAALMSVKARDFLGA